MSGVRISAALITRNEEHNITRALDSIDWVDEIIVLDSGSTDRTVEICRSKGVRVEHRDWEGYVAAKNAAMQLATGDWILSLDADEEVTKDLRDEIRRIVDDPGAFNGYRIPRRNHYLGHWIRHCGWYPDLQLRLWRRGKGHWGGGSVHESVTVDGTIGRLSGPLNHYTYSSISQHLDRIDRYAGLHARDRFQAGKSTNSLALFFVAPWQFLRLYVLRLGFLDGVHGLLVSAMGAHYAFLKKVRLWELQQRINSEKTS
jgi:glycosyltransferase involved in cell wall biosynthesis